MEALKYGMIDIAFAVCMGICAIMWLYIASRMVARAIIRTIKESKDGETK